MRTNPEARDRYTRLLPGGALPEGSVIVAFHHENETGHAGPVYVMEKAANGWTFRALDPDGHPTEKSVDLCRRCHMEAPADWLFGIPRGRSKPPAE